MAVRLQHPAFKGEKIAKEDVWKDRRPTWADIKKKQQLKKLKKKRKRG